MVLLVPLVLKVHKVFKAFRVSQANLDCLGRQELLALQVPSVVPPEPLALKARQVQRGLLVLLEIGESRV